MSPSRDPRVTNLGEQFLDEDGDRRVQFATVRTHTGELLPRITVAVKAPDGPVVAMVAFGRAQMSEFIRRLDEAAGEAFPNWRSPLRADARYRSHARVNAEPIGRSGKPPPHDKDEDAPECIPRHRPGVPRGRVAP